MARTDYYAITTPTLQATSQAIRTVNGTVGTIAPEDYPDLIVAMKSGTDYDNVMAQLVEETTTPAAIASFTDGANNLPVKELICTINPTETGTGAKSPANPYVIGGHTGINVTQLGGNLFDEKWERGSFNGNTGLPAINNAFSRSVNFIKVTPNLVLYFNVAGVNSTNNFFIWQYDSNKEYISPYTTISINSVFTLRNNCEYIKVSYRRSIDTIEDYPVSINLPSTATAYEPYITPTTHHADFGQTVYGGELNVTTGVLTVTWIRNQIKNLNFRKDTVGGRWGFYTVISTLKAPSLDTETANLKSEIYNTVTASGNTSYTNDLVIFAKTNKQVFIVDRRYSDATSFNSAVGDEWLYWELATPQTIQLDPIEVRTLLGANNLYHDCNGNIEVTYRANGALYVAQH